MSRTESSDYIDQSVYKGRHTIPDHCDQHVGFGADLGVLGLAPSSLRRLPVVTEALVNLSHDARPIKTDARSF